MAKGPVVTDKINTLIAETYVIHQDWTAKEIQVEVNKLCSGRGPGLSAIQKKLTQIRRNQDNKDLVNPVNEMYWGISNYRYLEIPPEALPIVLKAWLVTRSNGTNLTNREVKWITRLYVVIENIDTLIKRAIECARRELEMEILQHLAPLAHPMNVVTLIHDMTGKDIDEIWSQVRNVVGRDTLKEAYQDLENRNIKLKGDKQNERHN